MKSNFKLNFVLIYGNIHNSFNKQNKKKIEFVYLYIVVHKIYILEVFLLLLRFIINDLLCFYLSSGSACRTCLNVCVDFLCCCEYLGLIWLLGTWCVRMCLILPYEVLSYLAHLNTNIKKSHAKVCKVCVSVLHQVPTHREVTHVPTMHDYGFI